MLARERTRPGGLAARFCAGSGVALGPPPLQRDHAPQPLAIPDVRGPDDELANRLRAAFRAMLAERGADLAYGRKPA